MRQFSFGFSAIVLLWTIGCGASPDTSKGADMGGPDGTLISTLIEDTNDIGTNKKKLEAAFAKGVAIPDAKQFAKYSYSIKGKPNVSGDTATCKIAAATAIGEVSELEWTFAKDGDKWKIKSAPLP